MKWFRLRFHSLRFHLFISVILCCAILTIEARPNRRTALLNRQSWVPSWSSLTSGITTLTSYLPSLSAPPSLGLLQAAALSDLGAYLTDTMPAFSDVYASIPSWEQWQGMMPNFPRPSALFSQLPTELQNGMQQMWSQMNPLDVEQFRRRQYRRGVLLMLGLAGYYNGYQGMYKQYRKGIESYVEPHQRKRKFNEMKRICYYELPHEGTGDILEPSKIKAGMCTHIIVSHAKVGDHGNVVLPMDQYDDGHLEQMLGDLKKAAPHVLLCVSGRSQGEFSPMAEIKHHRFKFIRSSVGIVRRYGLAGIDLDWEFPGVGSGNPQDPENLAALVEEFRDYMEPWVKKDEDEKDSKKFILTATVSGMPEIISKSYDVKRLSKHLDWVNVMAYDYAMEQHGYHVMGHNAPLFDRSGRPSGLNVAATGMKWAQEGMPHEKIVIGLPLFGRSYAAAPAFRKRLGELQTVELAGQNNLDINRPESRFHEPTDSVRLGLEKVKDLTRNVETNEFPVFKAVGFNAPAKEVGFPSSTITSGQIPHQNPSPAMFTPETLNAHHEYSEQEGEEQVLLNNALMGDPVLEKPEAPLALPDSLVEVPHFRANHLGVLAFDVGHPSSGPGMGGGFVPYAKICSMVSNGTLQVRTDTNAGVPIATDGTNWISFDDTVSVSIKSRWVEDMGFGGVALYNLNMDDWEGNCDPNRTPFQMLRAVWKMLG